MEDKSSIIFPLALGGGDLGNAAGFGDRRGDDAEEGEESGEHGRVVWFAFQIA